MAHTGVMMYNSAANEQQQQLQALRTLADQLERSRMQALQQVQEGHGALQAAVTRAAELERANREGAHALAARDKEAHVALAAVQVLWGMLWSIHCRLLCSSSSWSCVSAHPSFIRLRLVVFITQSMLHGPN